MYLISGGIHESSKGFFSYSHDSKEHEDRVLELANKMFVSKRGSLKMTIGDRVRYFRTLANISNVKLAQMADLTPSQITKIETNVNNASVESLERICNAIGISLAEFFSLELEKTENNPPSEMDKLIFIAKKLAPEQILLLTKVAAQFVRPEI